MLTIEVVDRRTSAVLRIPTQQVFFVPTPTQAHDKTKKKPASTRLYLCDANDAAATSFSWCPLLGACNGVHANTCGAGSKQIHVNFAYKSPSDCQYPRLAADCVVGVREPVSARSANVDTVAAECILVTRCRIGPGHAMTRCAHFYYGRECHLGANCDFAHVIHINPNARQFELAPTPSSVGRGREASDPAAYGVYGEQQLHLALACRAAATPRPGDSTTPTTPMDATDPFALFESDGDSSALSSHVVTPQQHSLAAEPQKMSFPVLEGSEVPRPMPPMLLSMDGPAWWADEKPVVEPQTRTSSFAKRAGASWRHNPYVH